MATSFLPNSLGVASNRAILQLTSVLIYNASWSTFGGGEKYVCMLADVLSQTGIHEVSLLSDNLSITKDALRQYFNLDLARVHLLSVRTDEIRDCLARADIAVVVSNFKPYGNRAKKNVYVLQIPYPKITSLRLTSKALRGHWKEAGKDVFRQRLLRDARSADLVFVYSDFVGKTLRTHHGITSEVLYPPIDDFGGKATVKEHVILSVGRFFTGLYNDKRYDVLIEAFKKLREQLPNTSWQYRLVGSCTEDDASQRYLATLRKAAEGHPIYFHVNSPYADLRRHYHEATLFWHATGYGVEETRYPERMEHFGMSTVEAMSAECVPIVINRGGQKEIVSHGESGYLWNTVDELVQLTAQVIQNPAMVARVRQNARARFTGFDRQHFSDRLLSLMRRLA